MLAPAIPAQAPATGQHPPAVFDMEQNREPIVSLDGQWRFHPGDDPDGKLGWADPSFDDSHWPLINSYESSTRQGYPAFSGYSWYRFRIATPDTGEPVDLLLAGIANGYQVYANGRLIGSAGSTVPTLDPILVAPPTTFRLPESGNGAQFTQIALRVWTYQPLAFWIGAGSLQTGNAAGDPKLLSERIQSYRSQWLLLFVNEYAGALFAGLVGLAILALFLLRLNEKEYLWFSILLLSQCFNAAFHIAMNLDLLPFPLWYLLSVVLEATGVIAALVFFSIVLGRRRTPLWWAVLLLAATSPLAAALVYFGWAGVGVGFTLEAACILPAYAWIIAVLFLGTLRKDVSARLLLTPVTLSFGLELYDLSARIVWQLTGSKSLPTIDTTLFDRPFPTSLNDVVGFVFLLALLIFLVRRFSLARKEEERMAGELEAARVVQHVLIPDEIPSISGFVIDAVYKPAGEVGGDFFQIIPVPNGGLLAVIGDVSGKGMPAAMTVSLLVGTVRTLAHYTQSPGEILSAMNQRMLARAQGGFTTCLVLRVDRDGAGVVANAGHLAPYIDSVELEVESGLPLGLAADSTYPEITLQLAPDVQLSLMTDGVVEARNRAGELFGFERARTIATHSPESIASEAQTFGQQDDITVLTLRFAPVAAPA